MHKPGAERDIVRVKSQEEGMEIAREIAINQRLELIVQKRNGTIGLKNTYFEPDPFPPRG
ncbi:hypothetical protein A3D11_04295 [Candidatus Peribacteria bacterium RIFCSPHIGHO2_02_FULL_49_16]|nr:MAG: hypothetical protein A2880_00385 [Candidatus Peribacteria bacterium RIFCSPHIGHO2_01_FULL_49_38]OGJ59213.1 MAG: hypothetical protein A3D11_04295 [Candidatus Peribacteria bacterium RIFCSPHIGHO2_02_FULL_49_16]